MPASDKSYPSNYNALHDPNFGVTRGSSRGSRVMRGEAGAPSTRTVVREGAELEIEYDDVTGRPIRIENRGTGERLSHRSSTRGPAPAPQDLATDWIRENRDLWDLSENDAVTVEVISSSTQGLPAVRLQQRVNGVELFLSEITAAVSPESELVMVSGQLFPGAGAPVSRSRGGAGVDVSPEQAIAKACADFSGLAFTGEDFAPSQQRASREGSPYRYYDYLHEPGNGRPSFERPVRLKDVVFPTANGEFIPAYYMEIWIAEHPAFSYVIDTDDMPDILFRKNLTSGAFSFRVHNHGAPHFRPHDGPAPGTPHPTGIPDGYQAPVIPEVRVTLDGLIPGDPWLPAGATETRGNNCIAYADLTDPSGYGEGDILGRISAPGEFDYSYNHLRDTADANNLQASLVGMFFHVNWLHDRWYEAGFDEASGNAQMDNFGRGGEDGDPILAEGSDWSSTNNANMSTPADGESPRMQMFTFTRTNPFRTSNFEALITFHEMGHYISNRLVANGSGLGNLQGNAMGEGWGDFFAICMTSQPSDDFAEGAFAIGGWTDLAPDFKDNYYFSIRRYPYSADMKKNPLTFKHIGSNVLLPTDCHRLPGYSGANNEDHAAGEIWCAALWEMFVNLVAKHGHEEAEKRALKYVIGGLKLTTADPTFTHARNGIITTVSTLHPEDLPEVWAGFAKRGMGRNAVAPRANSRTLNGVVEDFNP